ncbi:unnamed protein product [Lymnaea stagnalis]|uniref:Uncharacterized protein n=1 Tax=Lymnaea stagnalis TaxID=6523 RepID=A0AAV2HCQ1_LYMST
MFLILLGSKRDPLDRLKVDDLDSEEDDIQLYIDVEECMSRFEDILTNVCQDDDAVEIMDRSRMMEGTKKHAGLFTDMGLSKTKTTGRDETYNQLVRHNY